MESGYYRVRRYSGGLKDQGAASCKGAGGGDRSSTPIRVSLTALPHLRWPRSAIVRTGVDSDRSYPESAWDRRRLGQPVMKGEEANDPRWSL